MKHFRVLEITVLVQSIYLSQKKSNRRKFYLIRFSPSCAIFRTGQRETQVVLAGDLVPIGFLLVKPVLYECRLGCNRTGNGFHLK